MTQQAVVTIKDAAQQLGVSRPTAIRRYNEGLLGGYKLNPTKRNSPLRIYQTSIDHLLKQRRS